MSTDVSSFGIGGVLLQLHGDNWKPVAYCSRRLTDAETRYVQTEKECIVGVWAGEWFETYLIGMDSFKLITDRKPLLPLINSKDLDAVPIRCQRLLMRLMRFGVKAEHAPGKTLVVADTPSHSPVNSKDSTTATDVPCHVNAVMDGLPVSQHKLDMIRAATSSEEQLCVIKYL